MTESLQDLIEDVDFEAKLAAGRDGHGAVPDSFWETYSAFANTDGGVILLGVEDKNDNLRPVGIKNPRRVVEQLWTDVNNKSRVNANLLRNQDVTVVDVEGLQLVHVRVPRAVRSQRPVFIGQNPFDGTYRRRGSADQKCTSEEVRRFLAEQVEEVRDDRLLVGMNVEDLNEPTIRRYRQRFQSHAPGHEFNQLDDREFLRQIGAWRRDRESQRAGLTLGGLLMFGRLVDIVDEVPHYFLDYQERPEAKAELRWVDRFSTDGSWSGNLFDFYTTVSSKLGEGIGVPWQLRGDQRIDDSPLHQALREALVNTLIHADFTGRTSILVVKRPDMFGFRNPGGFRVPIAEAVRGGESDCRNRKLQAMFRFVGICDQGGWGVPKILSAWRGHNWRLPMWKEGVDVNEQTQLILPRASLLQPQVVAELSQRLGRRFDDLPEPQRLALALATEEGSVTHTRLTELSGEHPRDATLALQGLVSHGLLMPLDRRRPVTYAIPRRRSAATQVSLFDLTEPESSVFETTDLQQSAESLQPSAQSSQQRSASFQQSGPSLQQSEANDDDTAGRGFKSRPLLGRRATPEQVSQAIRELCLGRWLTVSEIAEGLGRSPQSVRNHYLPVLMAAKALELRYRDQVNDPRQAYRAVDKAHEREGT